MSVVEYSVYSAAHPDIDSSYFRFKPRQKYFVYLLKSLFALSWQSIYSKTTSIKSRCIVLK